MLNKCLTFCTTMGLLKVHQVKHMQDVGMTEAIDLDEHIFIQEAAKLLNWILCCPWMFGFFFSSDGGS